MWRWEPDKGLEPRSEPLSDLGLLYFEADFCSSCIEVLPALRSVAAPVAAHQIWVELVEVSFTGQGTWIVPVGAAGSESGRYCRLRRSRS